MRRSSLSLLLLAACSGGGDDETTEPFATCDEIVAAPLPEVEATAWPDGMAEAIGTYNSLAGRWEATSSCGGTVALKFVTPTQEELQVVTESWSTPGLSCGCVTDPAFADDTAYDVIALHENFEFFVEAYDDPGLDAKNVMAAGALYGPGAPLEFRACGTTNIDPLLASEYEQATTVLRVESGGTMTGTLVLARTDGTKDTCDLSSFERIAR